MLKLHPFQRVDYMIIQQSPVPLSVYRPQLLTARKLPSPVDQPLIPASHGHGQFNLRPVVLVSCLINRIGIVAGGHSRRGGIDGWGGAQEGTFAI